jgi:crotonobetainyl-CoA:carnitine CoA-transferase CaiB-like acyl-CoA transferase
VAPLGRKGRQPQPTGGPQMDIVTILIIVILVLLAIYLFQRVF